MGSASSGMGVGDWAGPTFLCTSCRPSSLEIVLPAPIVCSGDLAWKKLCLQSTIFSLLCTAMAKPPHILSARDLSWDMLFESYLLVFEFSFIIEISFCLNSPKLDDSRLNGLNSSKIL